MKRPGIPNSRLCQLPILFALFCSTFVLRNSNFALHCEPADKKPRISQAASDSCALKVKGLEDFANAAGKKSGKKTRISEEELNSYLAIELRSKYHQSLRSLVFTLGDDKLEGVATVDFDSLGMSSSKFLAKMLAKLFSGVHDLYLTGSVSTAGGKGNFVLDEARFDANTLPNFLVEEIITAVGKKQKPPFDPLQPSQMPYKIDHVDVRKGFIVVYQ